MLCEHSSISVEHTRVKLGTRYDRLAAVAVSDKINDDDDSQMSRCILIIMHHLMLVSSLLQQR